MCHGGGDSKEFTLSLGIASRRRKSAGSTELILYFPNPFNQKGGVRVGAYACNFSTLEAGQEGLEFKVSLAHVTRLRLKTKTNQTKNSKKKLIEYNCKM
jgi:hypothetical protein